MLFCLLDHSQLPLVTDILYLRVKVLSLAFGANYSKGTFHKTTQGRLLCIVFIVFAVPLFAILLQFISLYINENLNALTDVVSFKLSRFRETWPVRFLEKISGPNELKSTVRKLIKVTQNYKKHHHTELVQVAYFIFGCGIFLVIPAYVFHLVEDWSYIDAVYFAIVSLTKIGFGDFVPNTQPPDKYAQVKQDKQKCLFLYLNPAPQPGNFQDEEKIACKPSQWSSVVSQLFAVYRVLVNFWMIIGLSFFGTLISIMANGINDVITKKAPSFLSNVVNMGNILHIINASQPEEDNSCSSLTFEPENNMINNELWSDRDCKDDEQLNPKDDETNILKVRNSKANK